MFICQVVGMDTWHHDKNPNGITVEMHGNIRWAAAAVMAAAAAAAALLGERQQQQQQLLVSSSTSSGVQERCMQLQELLLRHGLGRRYIHALTLALFIYISS
jgi:hypothetical protein